MNFTNPILQQISKFSPSDVMLADVAVRIQLSPTDYQRAVDRYNAINDWIDREDSPLHGLVEAFYPQGGFAIGATIAKHDADDDFDIDAMAQLSLSQSVDPETPLSILHRSIKGERGSRYFDMAERKTRCSTVNYVGMHLDVTPAILMPGHRPKTSIIFHSKPEDPREPKMRLFANPSGFADWFKTMTPADEAFAQYFEGRSLDYERMRRMEILAKAEADPVPEQLPAYRKSLAVIALQLIKRWRNITYDKRYPNLRRPPSVLLSFYVARHANKTRSLTDEVIYQAECMISVIESASSLGRTICEVNPMCDKDELTDRWPSSVAEQRLFSDELRALVVSLNRLKRDTPLQEMQRILNDLFGEKPAREAVRKYIDQHAQDRESRGSFHTPGIGAVPAIGAAALVSRNARATPQNTFFGDD